MAHKNSDDEGTNARGEPGSRKREREVAAIAAVIIVGLLIRLPSLLSNGFLSDESVYVYAAYAIGSGVTPYVQIMLPHPPLGYLILVPTVIASQGSLLTLRIFNLGTYLIDALLAYWLFRIIRQNNSSSFHPMAAFVLFTLYPLPFAITTPLEFTVFDIPILLATILFVTGVPGDSRKRLLVSGGLIGAALMIWFTAAFFAISLVAFLAFYERKKETRGFLRRFAKSAVAMILGGLIAIALVLALITVWGGLSNFIVQSVGLQSSLRASFTLTERLYHILYAILLLLPMFVVASVGILEIALRAKRGSNPLILLPAWIVLMNLGLVFTLPRIVLNHYVAYLLPFIAFLAVGPFEKLEPTFSWISRKLTRPPPWYLFQSALATILIISAFLTLPYQSGYLQTSPYTLANQTVGQYVAGITSPGNAIWTSEGSIAYFASRLIQAPNSTQWPFQAEYNDIFNTTYVDADGVVQHGLGVVSPSQFVTAWGLHQTRVLIFILGNGPVPYPDGFLWYGFSETPGVTQWVNSNYHLARNFTFTGVGYQYLVWYRNQP